MKKDIKNEKEFNQGYYKPIHPEKYVGDVKKIRYMSSWEYDYNKFLDMNKNVLRWSSEEIAIPYYNILDKKPHKYYPDYWIEYKNKYGKIKQEIHEIKPLKEAQQAMFLIESGFKIMPKITSRKQSSRNYEKRMLIINACKWHAAKNFCHKYGIEFKIVTEKSLFRG